MMGWEEVGFREWKLSVPKVGYGIVFKGVFGLGLWDWAVFIFYEGEERQRSALWGKGLEDSLEDAKKRVEEVLELVGEY